MYHSELSFKKKVELFLEALYLYILTYGNQSGPAKRSGTVGIRPNNLLEITLNLLLQSGGWGADYAQHIGTSFKPFRRACQCFEWHIYRQGPR